jgi:RND superfamily putative drug exporter
MAAFATTLHASGLSTAQSFTARTDSVVGQEELTKYFPGGQGEPTQIVVSAAKVDAVIAALKSSTGVSEVLPQTVSPIIPGEPVPATKIVDGKELLNVTLAFSPDSDAATSLVKSLRDTVHAIDAGSLVGGTSAVFYDTHVATVHDQKLIIPVILILIGIILALLLRSVFASILLLITVVLSFLATLGVCALVFHHIFHFVHLMQK